MGLELPCRDLVRKVRHTCASGKVQHLHLARFPPPSPCLATALPVRSLGLPVDVGGRRAKRGLLTIWQRLVCTGNRINDSPRMASRALRAECGHAWCATPGKSSLCSSCE